MSLIGALKFVRKIPKILLAYARKWKVVKTSDSLQKLSRERLDKCIICPWSQVSKIVQVVNGNAQYEDTLVCNKCSCPCVEKTLVKSEKCLLNKWIK